MRERPCILAVDDVFENLEIVSLRLEASGYEVITATDGIEALEQARTHKPDLILLDIMMPKLDGISVLKELKADPNLGFIPILLLTAKADRSDVIAGLEAGADDYLTKPLDQSALVARVRSMLRIKALHDKVQDQARQLATQAKELAEWNRVLEARVAEQVAEIERISRLKRFLAPQVVDVIALSGDPDAMLASHSAEVTVLFCDLRGFTAFTEAAEPVAGDESSERIPRRARRSHPSLRGNAGAFRRRRPVDLVQRSPPLRRSYRARGTARDRHARAA